jgi:hypothetical protein
MCVMPSLWSVVFLAICDIKNSLCFFCDKTACNFYFDTCLLFIWKWSMQWYYVNIIDFTISSSIDEPQEKKVKTYGFHN